MSSINTKKPHELIRIPLLLLYLITPLAYIYIVKSNSSSEIFIKKLFNEYSIFTYIWGIGTLFIIQVMDKIIPETETTLCTINNNKLIIFPSNIFIKRSLILNEVDELREIKQPLSESRLMICLKNGRISFLNQIKSKDIPKLIEFIKKEAPEIIVKPIMQKL